MALPISYHWRSLFARRATTVLTVLVVTAVVGALAWMLGFRAALQRSLAVASDPRKLIILAPSATAEANSALPIDSFNRLTQVNGIADGADGRALLSPEMVVQVSLPRMVDGGKTNANVAVRGVTPTAFAVHRVVHPPSRVFSTGEPEVIVGAKAAQQFAGLRIGDKLRLGSSENREYTVVGHFTADGGPLESEIWGYLPSLLNAYGRTTYSSASALLREGTDSRGVIEQIRGPAIQLGGQTERDYWTEQSKNISIYLMIVGMLVAMMSTAAIFSIANTMYAAVAGRTREIAMLRTIGYSRGKILLGFLLEAVMLALLGGALGCLACAAWLLLAGNTKDMFGFNTFTTLAFEIHLTPLIVAMALVTVEIVGALGELLPAIRASRIQVIAALREA
jgi:ABC-type lipoprotein release transport system permease subunit